MSLHIELLDQADRLLAGPPSGPTDADIRRSMSAAYYAVFHVLVQDSTDLLCPVIPELTAAFRRSFDHSVMKKVCVGLSQARGSPANMPKPLSTMFLRPVDPAIVAIANAFSILQTDRHLADYDTSNPISPAAAQASVATARAAIQVWQAVCGTDDAKIFLTALLLHGRWTRS